MCVWEFVIAHHSSLRMFGSIQPTPYDLQFSVFGIPVRVLPSFWLVGAIMGWSEGWAQMLGENVLAVVLVWLVCIFASILVHELGHAVMARAFGWPPEVVLYHFGGLAMYNPTWRHTPARSIVISLAGPGAGFILYAIVRATREVLVTRGVLGPEPHLGHYAVIQLEYINLWWGLVNLLPVLPLDGGRVSEQVLGILRVRNSADVCLKISVVVAGAVALYFLMNEVLYAGLLFAFLCVNSIQMLQSTRRW